MDGSYEWHFLFQSDPITPFILDEKHPELEYVSERCILSAAILVDRNKAVHADLDDPKQLEDATVYAVEFFGDVRLLERFRRCEKVLNSDKSRKVPVLKIHNKDEGKDWYYFAFSDKYIKTASRKFYREDWS